MSLKQLALKHGTDKGPSHHNYTEIYERYFGPYRFYEDIFFLLEIGVGGYTYTDRGGESLRMWEDYFQHGLIMGIDIHPKNIKTKRALVIQGSQDDPVFIQNLVDEYGTPVIVIDDGSHNCELCIKSFEILFPLLAPGGIYVVEDIESSWAEGWASGCADYTNYSFPSTINYFRQLTDRINAQYIPHYPYGESPTIESIHFYKNMIFILKK